MEVPSPCLRSCVLSSLHRVWLIKGVFHMLVKTSKLMSAVRLSSLAVKPTTTSDSTESERALRDVQERIVALEAQRNSQLSQPSLDEEVKEKRESIKGADSVSGSNDSPMCKKKVPGLSEEQSTRRPHGSGR